MQPVLKTCNIKSTHKTKARFSGLLRHPAWKQNGTILVEWERMEKQEKRWSKKGKKVKDTKRHSRRWGSEGIRGGGLLWAHTGPIIIVTVQTGILVTSH